MFLEVMAPEEVNGYLDDFRANFYLLDKSLIKEDGNDGLACYKKYSNEGRGMAPELIQSLSTLAQQIQEGRFVPSEESRLMLVDLFVIYSNHIDQQQKDTLYPKLPEARKQAVVLLFLDVAATLIAPLLSKEVSPRILSSSAQLNFYRKGLRYRGIEVETRLEYAQSAIKAVEYLETLSLSEEDDPHAYVARKNTYRLIANYCLQDLHRYDEAAETVRPATESSDPTAKAQGLIQIALIFMKKQEKFGVGIEEALKFTTQAMQIDLSTNQLVSKNVFIMHMRVLNESGYSEEASRMAEQAFAEHEKDPNCGFKPHHLEEAGKIRADRERVKVEVLTEESESPSLKP